MRVSASDLDSCMQAARQLGCGPHEIAVLFNGAPGVRVLTADTDAGWIDKRVRSRLPPGVVLANPIRFIGTGRMVLRRFGRVELRPAKK